MVNFRRPSRPPYCEEYHLRAFDAYYQSPPVLVARSAVSLAGSFVLMCAD